MLSDYKPESRVIELSGSSFAIVGLSLESFTLLVREHLDDLEHVYDMVTGALKNGTDISDVDIQHVIMTVAQELPTLCASIICASANEDSLEARNAALRISAPKQIEILIAVFELTFTEVGGIKKAIEIVTNLMVKIKPKAQAQVSQG